MNERQGLYALTKIQGQEKKKIFIGIMHIFIIGWPGSLKGIRTPHVYITMDHTKILHGEKKYVNRIGKKHEVLQLNLDKCKTFCQYNLSKYTLIEFNQ